MVVWAPRGPKIARMAFRSFRRSDFIQVSDSDSGFRYSDDFQMKMDIQIFRYIQTFRQIFRYIQIHIQIFRQI